MYIIHPSTSTKVLFRAFYVRLSLSLSLSLSLRLPFILVFARLSTSYLSLSPSPQPFVSAKFWKKLHYIDNAPDLYRDVHFRGRPLTLPEYVIRYHVPKRKVFGTPIEEAMIETPQGFLLPPVLELTIFHLCTEGSRPPALLHSLSLCFSFFAHSFRFSVRSFPSLSLCLFDGAGHRAAGVEVEGIFRVSGPQSLIERLKALFDEGNGIVCAHVSLSLSLDLCV